MTFTNAWASGRDMRDQRDEKKELVRVPTLEDTLGKAAENLQLALRVLNSMTLYDQHEEMSEAPLTAAQGGLMQLGETLCAYGYEISRRCEELQAKLGHL